MLTRILISMPEEFLNEIDDFAEYEGRTRSELIREALRGYMDKQTASTKKTNLFARLLD